MSDLKHRIMTSWLWVPAAYGVMALWLYVTTGILLGVFSLGFEYEFLAVLNGIAHYVTVLCVCVLGFQVYGKKRTVKIALLGIFVWELMEWVTRPLWTDRIDPSFITDTMADVALGLFGLFTAILDSKAYPDGIKA